METGTMPAYETRELVGVLEQNLPPSLFFLSTFFRREKLSMARTVEIDIIKGKRKVAPYSRPMSEGRIMDNRGFSTNQYQPPYMKPLKTLSPSDLGKRLPGNTVYDQSNSPAALASRSIGEKLGEMEVGISRAEEIQAAQALQTGKVTIDGDGYNNVQIDFLMNSTHLPTRSGTTRWNVSTGTPLDDIKSWQEDLILADSGLHAGVLIFGKNAWAAFKAREFGVGKTFDMMKVNNGEINPQQLSPGVIYLGFLKEQGVDMYLYNDYYEDANGDTQPMMHPDKVLMGSVDALCVRHYGMIEDFDANGIFKRFPKSWFTKNPSALFVQLQSAPLMALHQPDAFVCATVIG